MPCVRSPTIEGVGVLRLRENIRFARPDARDEDVERAAELARMMSGGVTPKALARARELLDEARQKK